MVLICGIFCCCRVFSLLRLFSCIAAKQTPQRRALLRLLNFQKCSENGMLWTFWLGNVLRATTACTFSMSQLQKVLRTWCALYILTWTCAWRRSGVYFFDISNSKSAPNVKCLLLFHLQMCFALQRRATFHLSSDQMAPHPPLSRAYFSTLRNHKSLVKHSEPLPFRPPASSFFSLFLFSHLLSSTLLFSLTLPIFAFPPRPTLNKDTVYCVYVYKYR